VTCLLSFLGLVVIVAGLGGLLARDAVRARDALGQAAAGMVGLEAQLRESPEAATADLAQVQASARSAVASTSGPLWRLAAAVPVVGDNTDALAGLAQTLDRLATDVLPRMSQAAQVVTPENLAPVNGRLDLIPMLQVHDDVVAADAAVEAALARVSAINRDPLIEELATAADDLQTQLEQVSQTTHTAARAVDLIPAMLGANGPREWVVLAQNNAEQRATGGTPGIALLMRAERGNVKIVDTLSTANVGRFDAPVLPLTSSEQGLWGNNLGTYLQDITFTPDFPRTGRLAAQMWTQMRGDTPSGVLSVDPVALQGMLAATGPVTFTDPFGDEVTLTANNAAEFLMSGIYAAYDDNATQDEVFGLAAQAAFTALLSGGADARTVVDALVSAADQGRLMVWSADEGEQGRLAGTVLSGELHGTVTSNAGETSPVVGVHLNLTTGSKIGYFLDTSTRIENAETLANGSQVFTVRVTLRNMLEPGDGAKLPDYVIGDGPDDGTIRTNVYVYAPSFGEIENVTNAAGEPVVLAPSIHEGLQVGVREEVIEPGQTHETLYRIVSGRQQRGDIVLRVTPGARA
jgi:hypothetical protein